jgi:hydroxyacylglutathione hydrolase
MIDVITLSTPELGDRSYIVHDGDVGVAIDPQRDWGRLLDAATVAGVRIAYVAETHIHNDYVSGGWAFARHLGVPYLVAEAEEVAFERRPVRDGDEIPVSGSFSLRVVATPGHTPHHLTFVAVDQGLPVMACTGGSLLFGSVGRTDLLGSERTRPLAHQQYRSAHTLGRLPGQVAVLPTHGFGSFCSVSPSTVDVSTIGEERVANLAFRAGSEDEFVATLLSSLGSYPRYYHRMGPANRVGTPVPDLSAPPDLDGDQVHRLATSEAWVVDLRSRGAFAAGHLVGSINIEQDTPFTTYLGWLLPDDTPLVLMAENRKAVEVAQVDLSRIGIDEIAGRYIGGVPPVDPLGASGSYPVRGFDDLARQRSTSDSKLVALDVRRREEWEEAHLEGSVHVPLDQLEDQIDQLPPGTVWVHCAAGYRAGIAASLLARHGREVVLVDGRFTS